MTQEVFGRMLVVGVLAAILAGCGKYGPPQPIAPEPRETSEDEEERR